MTGLVRGGGAPTAGSSDRADSTGKTKRRAARASTPPTRLPPQKKDASADLQCPSGCLRPGSSSIHSGFGPPTERDDGTRPRWRGADCGQHRQHEQLGRHTRHPQHGQHRQHEQHDQARVTHPVRITHPAPFARFGRDPAARAQIVPGDGTTKREASEWRPPACDSPSA